MTSVFIETSIISYLRRRQSRSIVTAARQIQTRLWWDERKNEYELFASALVVEEASRGDEVLANERLLAIADLPLSAINKGVEEIGNLLVDRAALPEKARVDPLHISTAAFHGVDYLLTWNCKHIANALMRPKIESILNEIGCAVPVICTPDELLEGEQDEE